MNAPKHRPDCRCKRCREWSRASDAERAHILALLEPLGRDAEKLGVNCIRRFEEERARVPGLPLGALVWSVFAALRAKIEAP